MNCKCDVVELSKARIEKKFKTIIALAVAAGIDRSELGKIFNGKKQPSAKEMYALVSSLELSPERAGKIFFAQELTQNASFWNATKRE